jgi:hypothetical protein
LAAQTLKIEIIDSQPKKQKTPALRPTAARRTAMSHLQACGGFALGLRPAASGQVGTRCNKRRSETGPAAGAAATSYRGAVSTSSSSGGSQLTVRNVTLA